VILLFSNLIYALKILFFFNFFFIYISLTANYLLFNTGLTVSYGKPSLNKILNSIVHQLKKLELGITLKINNIETYVRFFLLYAVFDKPARAAILNLKNSTGYFGCLKCYQSGKNVIHKSKLLFKLL
jgi:hypothetical protein